MKIRNQIEDLIIKSGLTNYSLITELFNDTDFIVQKSGAQLAGAEKDIYDKEDIEKIDRILNLLKDKFPERGENSTKKKLLSSK